MKTLENLAGEVVLNKTDDVSFIRINDELISDVERLTKILENKHTTVETRGEINKTIQEYMKEIRRNHMVIPFE